MSSNHNFEEEVQQLFKFNLGDAPLNKEQQRGVKFLLFPIFSANSYFFLFFSQFAVEFFISGFLSGFIFFSVATCVLKELCSGKTCPLGLFG